MGAVIATGLWQWTGFTMLIFIAGLTTLPKELQEAARIDGANAWQRFWSVTWPWLAPTVTINTVLTVIGGLKVFDVIYVLTKGGLRRRHRNSRGPCCIAVDGGPVRLFSGVERDPHAADHGHLLILLAFLRRRELAA